MLSAKPRPRLVTQDWSTRAEPVEDNDPLLLVQRAPAKQEPAMPLVRKRPRLPLIVDQRALAEMLLRERGLTAERSGVPHIDELVSLHRAL